MSWVRNNRRMRSLTALAALPLAFALGGPETEAPAAAADGMCRVVQVDLLPTDDLQMVVWLEDDAGNYVDTLYITRTTGSYGLGNRPGMMEFNSAWRWPYGRRTSVFPVWAHRHTWPDGSPMTWPEVDFQNSDDTNLSHPLGQSSVESFYCRPLQDGEPAWDTQSCASTIYSDKGTMANGNTSLYPPRSDLSGQQGTDSPDVDSYAQMNPFDLVSRATPPGGDSFTVSWSMPDNLPAGNYVIWVEVNKEFDQNTFYDYPAPSGIPWSQYGLPYRGQPSVVYRVPFTLGTGETNASTMEYVGYGDPDGATGDLNSPDGTITEGTPGSGASRLLLIDDGGSMYRVKVSARPTIDKDAPAIASELTVVDMTATDMTLSFVAPADPPDNGRVAGYDIRILAGEPITAANWGTATPIATVVKPVDPGGEQDFVIPELEPRTNYYVGVRAYDACGNLGDLVSVHALTPQRDPGRVDACFVATAAYGSLMEPDVTMLRSFRDRYLRKTVTGELMVESYYTFGPALAKLIAPSDTAREAARAALGPLVDAVRQLAAEKKQR